MENNRVSLKSSETSACQEFSSFFDDFVSSIINLNESQTNEILKKSRELAHQSVKLNNSLPQHCADSVDTLNFIDNKINKVDSVHKRQKIMDANPLYVAPKEYAIGTRWETVTDKSTGKRFRKSVQSTQYVSIIETLKSTFGNPQFLKLYLE